MATNGAAHESQGDRLAADAMLINLTKEWGDISAAITKNNKETADQYTALHNHYNGLKADSEEIKAAVAKHTAEYAELVTKQQMLQQALDQVKREIDVPLLKGGGELAENDRKAAIELQRRAFVFKGGDPEDFKEDLENLVDCKTYRSAVRKLVKYVGIESKAKVYKNVLNDLERKAFDASSLDAAMFSPEMLGIELNCIIECAELLDLYNSVSVSKSTYMYPQVLDYGAIGKYDCDAKCDAEMGPEGNITYKGGQISDYRGVFCFQRKVLAEANYDLLNFMYYSATRSYRINRNRALMIGSGPNEPQGWLTDTCFPVRKTKAATIDHVELRMLLGSIPIEYGPTTIVMHQNTFAYLASIVDSIGRFVYGDGLMSFSPNDVRENIRISNCLPDPTENLTLGGVGGGPFVTGSFILAIGAWNAAFYAVNKRPLWIEQWEGKSTAWCVAYSFGAEDGGFVACCKAATILQVGP